MTDRDFSRQSFLGANSEVVLAGMRVAIVGLGGGGSHVAQQLTHIGVGEIRVVDPDRIEASNLNRLVGAKDEDVVAATPKVLIAERQIKEIRPWITVVPKMNKWQEVAELLRDVHVIFGCVDGYEQRAFLEGAARRFGVAYIDIGMDVAQIGDNSFAIGGQMIMTLPNGPCMQCLGFITPERLSQEENRYGDAGINPQVVWTNGTLASLAIGCFIKLVTPWFASDPKFIWLELDGNAQVVQASRQPNYISVPESCPHHGGKDGIGDPFFSLR